MKRGLLVFLGLTVLGLGLVPFRASRLDREERRELQTLTDDLRGARAFEDPEQGGVPEAVYRQYLSVFSAYNDSVAVWQDRADALRESEERCRDLAQLHNTLGDSLRDLYGRSGDAIP